MTINRSQVSTSHPSRHITEEQFDQVITAIIRGKYSWACVLLLRFVQCDPLHYIPYRTYSRLMKRNLEVKKKRQFQSSSLSQESERSAAHCLGDLDYFEDISSLPVSVKGGSRLWCLFSFQRR